MKHTSKALVIASLAVAMIAPLTASAAWWNPFSWFKKNQTPKVEIVATTTLDSKIDVTVPPVMPPVVPAKPSNPAPVKTTPPATVIPAVKTTAKPTTSPTKPTSVTPPSTTSAVVQVEVPTYVLNTGFTPAGFISPRNVKNGTTLLTIESVPGKTQALGTWYIDSITWRIVSEAYRSGDLTVSLVSGVKIIEDTSVINESHTTKISSHVASDPISFVINGQTPRKGMVRIEIESIKGHMSTSADIDYTINGTPLVGPDFSISGN